MTLPELSRHTAQQFAQTYGRPPRWIAAAPGRVNVIGEHTDYNDGFVLPMAIDRYTVIAAAPVSNGSAKVQLRSTVGKDVASLDLTQPVKPAAKGTWSNYPVGVIAGFLARGAKMGGFDALIHSTVPLGGGLSSSAAYRRRALALCSMCVIQLPVSNSGMMTTIRSCGWSWYTRSM